MMSSNEMSPNESSYTKDEMMAVAPQGVAR